VHRVTHEGMCSLTCKTGGMEMDTTALPEVPESLSDWDRQQYSARKNAVKLFDGAGEDGRTRLPG
jgi:hypothetical protein